MRGAVLDIFSPSSFQPVRIELIGDEIVQIKNFNPVNQRSLKELKNVSLIPVTECMDINKKKELRQETGLSPLNIIVSTSSNNNFDQRKVITCLDHFSQVPFLWNLDNSSHLEKHLSSQNRQNIKEVVFESFIDSKDPIPLPYSVPVKNFFSQISWSKKIKAAKKNNFFIFISIPEENKKESIKDFFEIEQLVGKTETFWSEMKEEQLKETEAIHLINRVITGKFNLTRGGNLPFKI